MIKGLVASFILLAEISTLKINNIHEDTGKWFPLRDKLLGQAKEGMKLKANTGCGYKSDCSLDYEISDINEMAMNQQNANETADKILEQIHDQARVACATPEFINEHGGWCYAGEEPVRAGKFSDIDYHLGGPDHIAPDHGFVTALVSLLEKDGPKVSITDLGAGVGQFGHALRVKLPNLEYYGYDGAGNVEEYTNKYVRFTDLSQPLNLKRTDWVFSSEVGEHIPHHLEKQVIANLHAHNCKGIILTWAVLNQPGKGHINNHSNQYLMHIFEELGYKLNQKHTDALRKSASSDHWWLAGSTMVFERVVKPQGCDK